VDRTGSLGSSTVIDFTGPQRVLEDPEPLVTGRRARHGNRQDDTPDEPASARRAVARHSHEAEPDDAATTSRSRRRVNWRKGTDVDEELWPTEAFGGVSDEQFWDDMAADKPLATTARTAQPDTAAKRRPGPLPDLYPGDDRGRGDGRRSAAEGPGTHPQPRLAPDDRTAIQPAATSPVATQPYPTATQPYPTATQPYPTAAQPSPAATQPVRAAQQPAESRGRSRVAISEDEDPLTSPAYSLRPKGSVDGRSYPSSRRSRDLSREQYESAIGQETQTFSLADAQAAGGGYPDGVRPVRQSDRPSYSENGRGRPDAVRSDPLRSDPLRSDGYRSDPLRSDPLRSDPVRPDPLRSGDAYGGTGPNGPNAPSTAYPYPQQPYGEPTQSMNAPPYGESYGYGHPAGPGGDPRRANGGWNPGRAGANGTGDGSWGSRPEYPSVNGYRGPYDPRGNDRR
jgi:hypothetical protein